MKIYNHMSPLPPNLRWLSILLHTVILASRLLAPSTTIKPLFSRIQDRSSSPSDSMARRQADQIYAGLWSSSASSVHVSCVLDLQTAEKPAVNQHIENKLTAHGFQTGDLLGSQAARARLNRMIQELKTEASHSNIFTRTLAQGEPVGDVDRAIHQLISLTQHNRSKRARRDVESRHRREAELRHRYSQPHSVQPGLVAPVSQSGPAPTDRQTPYLSPDLSPAPSERLIFVYSEGEPNPDMFALRETVSAASQTASAYTDYQFAVFKSMVADRLAPRILDWSNLTGELDGLYPKCDCQSAFAMICGSSPGSRPHIILKGLRALTAPTICRPQPNSRFKSFRGPYMSDDS